MKEQAIPSCPRYKIECSNAKEECDFNLKVCQTTARLNAQMEFEMDDENIINYDGKDSWMYPQIYDRQDDFEADDLYDI